MKLNNFVGRSAVAVAFVFATATFSHAQTFATPQQSIQGSFQPTVQVQGGFQQQYQPTAQAEVIVQQPTKEELAKSSLGASFYDAGTSALVVGSVYTNSPAQKAGLQSGDKLMKLNGEAIASSNSFNAMIREMNPGETVTLTRSKNGKEADVKVALATMADILKASIVPEAGAYDSVIARSEQQLAVLRQKIKNTEMDLEDLKKGLATQEKDLADLKTKAATAAKEAEAAKAKAAEEKAAEEKAAAAKKAAEAKAKAAADGPTKDE